MINLGISSTANMKVRLIMSIQLIPKLKKLSEVKSFNELDYAITKKEILHCMKLLKNSKSARLDSIINEVLKAIREEIRPVLDEQIIQLCVQLRLLPLWIEKSARCPCL